MAANKQRGTAINNFALGEVSEQSTSGHAPDLTQIPSLNILRAGICLVIGKLGHH